MESTNPPNTKTNNSNSAKSMELDTQPLIKPQNDTVIEEDDDDEEEDEDEEEEEDEENKQYKLRFEGEMDPLAFTEDDAFGLQPYQQFQRLENEYEALASKKRKFLATPRKPQPKKVREDDDPSETFEEIMEAMTYNMRRKSRRAKKKKGRRKGSKNKVSAEVTKKLGDATLHYAHGRYDEAISFLKDVIRISPNLPDPYHTLGLVYNAIGDKERALNFYMLAAHLTPKDESMWKLLVTWSIEQGNNGQAMYCLSKAISADPEDLSLRFHRASLYVELKEYQKAAESYEQISRLRPDNVEALKTASKLYQKCGHHERAVNILEDYLISNPNEADLSIVYLLVSLQMEGNAYGKALNNIEHVQHAYCAGKQFPLYLTIKAGVCHLYLGNVEKAESIFSVLLRENAHDQPKLIVEVADALAKLEHYGSALKYYALLEGNDVHNSGYIYSKMAECHLYLGERLQSIEYYYKALDKLNDNVDTRLNLASLLIEENKENEAITVLSCPNNSESTNDQNSDKCKPWWMNVRIKLKLSQIYKTRGSSEAFIDAIYPSVQESLFIETIQQKVRARKRLPKRVLFERVKVLDECQADNVFRGFRPLASASDLSKASRAKKLLQKKEAKREEKRAAALAAGLDWKSDDSDDEPCQTLRQPPLPNLLKDEEHHSLIIDLCKALALVKRYWEALEIINLSLKLASNALSVEKKEELRSLGAQIAYSIADPSHGWDCARYIVNQHPYSFAAWNCYYKVISRLDNRYSRHNKFLHAMRVKHKDCIPPIIIFGHQLTMISQHQAAAKEYLEAYKLMPDNPLINLCVGSALISLSLGHRLQNKHQCILQGLAFLFNNLMLSENSQEALYNIGRAYHHVGLVSLATTYYEKVLSIRESDYPIPKLPNENPDPIDNPKPGYCNLRREAAYNLHLIYKKSGAIDLARQVLKDHCSL